MTSTGTPGGTEPGRGPGLALAGCMATDVVHILTKGRAEPRPSSHLAADRADSEPRRIAPVACASRERHVPADKVERAIALSREKYCSVWHSLRPDIDFTTSFDRPPG